jgi:hypothetical protein
MPVVRLLWEQIDRVQFSAARYFMPSNPLGGPMLVRKGCGEDGAEADYLREEHSSSLCRCICK